MEIDSTHIKIAWDDWKLSPNTWELCWVTGNCFRVTCRSFKIPANWLEISKLHVTTLHVAVGCTCCSWIFRSKPIFVSHVCSRFATISDDLQVSGDNLQWLGQVAGVRRPFSAISHNFPVIRRLFSLVSGDFQVSRVCLRRFRTVCRCPEANSDHFQQLNVTVGGLQWFRTARNFWRPFPAILDDFLVLGDDFH